MLAQRLEHRYPLRQRRVFAQRFPREHAGFGALAGSGLEFTTRLRSKDERKLTLFKKYFLPFSKK